MAKKTIVSAGKLSLFSAVSSLSAKTDTGNAVDGGLEAAKLLNRFLQG